MRHRQHQPAIATILSVMDSNSAQCHAVHQVQAKSETNDELNYHICHVQQWQWV